MNFEEVLDQAMAMLQRRGRVSYRTLALQFHLDAESLEALKEELIEVHQLAVDQDGKLLVWIGEAPPTSAPPPLYAERRQLTVLFCDLVGSTALSSQLDPEDLREVVRAYQAACAAVIQRLDGSIAQYLGDGLLVYFGYPQAHDDDAQRAVRAGLEMVEAMDALNARLERAHGVHLAIRLGIHTGVVVVGEVGGGDRQERLALGETPNIAARLQGLALPDTVVISAATYRLVQGFFACQPQGTPALKGVAQPLEVYCVLGASGAQSRFEVAVTSGLTPLVGREEELALVQQHWVQARDGHGQVVVLSGEAGLGKSRLVQEVRERVGRDGVTQMTMYSVSSAQQSPLYPVLTHLHRLLHRRQNSTPATQCAMLERVLATYRFPREDTAPLLAALLGLPLPAHIPPLSLSPQRQRQRTLDTLIAWLLEEAVRCPVLLVWEDLHWADPSSLELLGRCIAQAPTARLLLLLTCRSEFQPPWPLYPHLTQLPLMRLTRQQSTAMVARIAAEQALPAAVGHQIVAQTDGVPLFVEELTKMVLESSLLQEPGVHDTWHGPVPPLAIPATLHDSLMARLDRLGEAKAVAQLGATIGRDFAYELLQAVAPWDEAAVQQGLRQLVEAELLYQQGTPPQATYRFKHALIQDTAYQSLLRSTRQPYHQRIAQVLENQFPELAETQPELLAHHFTAANLATAAVTYWQRAGQRASARAAYTEAVAHLTRGLEVLAALPPIAEQAQHELVVQTTLGPALIASKGYTAPEVEQTYARARLLCAQVGETPALMPILRGLRAFYFNRGELSTARELEEELYRLAQRTAEPTHLLAAHAVLGQTLCLQGDYATARTHLEHGIALIDPAVERTLVLSHGFAPGVMCLAYTALALWSLGFPAQAVERAQETLALAQALAHPLSLAMAQQWVAFLYVRRREIPVVQALADALLTLATTQEFPHYTGMGMYIQGWALAAQGQGAAGIAQMQQVVRAAGLASRQAQIIFLLPLAEALGHAGQVADGLRLLAEAFAGIAVMGAGDLLADAYRLQGELLLRQAIPEVAQAEACFQQALAVARRQQAKAWELRAATSLSRLWQQQGQRIAAHQLLAPIYEWYTEGFDTADLQEARTLLEELA